jgi:hypothetical protein
VNSIDQRDAGNDQHDDAVAEREMDDGANHFELR